MVAQSYTTCLGCIVNASSSAKFNASSTDSCNTDSETARFCPTCVHASLQSVRERHQLAKETWHESRTKCAEYFQQQHISGQGTTTSSTISESTIQLYEQRYLQLRTELKALQQDCSSVAMETCALNLCKVEQLESLSTVQDQCASQRRQTLSQLQQSLCGNCCQSDTRNIVDASDDADKSVAIDMANVRQNCTGAFIQSIELAQATIRTLRFHWSLQAFVIFRIQVEDDDMFRRIKCKEQGDGTKNRRLLTSREGCQVLVSGIGKICGLPLPHAGMELYGFLPYEELRSALRLVAQLTHMIARCFNMRLPHPIVMEPSRRQPPSSSLFHEPKNQQRHQRRFVSASSHVNYYDEDIANLANHTRNNLITSCGSGTISIAASLTSLSSILGGVIVESQSTVSGPTRIQHIQLQQQNYMLLSMDPKHVEERIRHTTSAIIAEDKSRKTFYTLSTVSPFTNATNNDVTQQNTANSNLKGNNNIDSVISDKEPTALQQQKIHDEFAIALQLLQNNILMICMNVGVPIDQLYPGEALLLNLYALQLYCSENV